MQSGEQVTINGQLYRIGALLSGGGGSYGQVFAACNAKGQPVALKVVHTTAMSQASPALHDHWRAHLACEIAFLTAQQAHPSPHIVQLYDHGLLAGQPVLVLERLSANLGQWWAAHRPLSGATIASFAAQILQALTRVHAAGFVYADLKLGNLLIDEAGAQLKLADFGSLIRQGDQPYTLVGTPATMAPEQMLPAEKTAIGPRYQIDPRADHYALGLLLFSLITERPTTAAQRRLSQWLVTHGPISLGAVGPSATFGLDDRERLLLQAATAQLFATAQPMAQLIERLLSRHLVERPTPAEMSDVFEAARRPARVSFPSPRTFWRQPKIAWALRGGVLACSALAGVVSAAMWMWPAPLTVPPSRSKPTPIDAIAMPAWRLLPQNIAQKANISGVAAQRTSSSARKDAVH